MRSREEIKERYNGYCCDGEIYRKVKFLAPKDRFAVVKLIIGELEWVLEDSEPKQDSEPKPMRNREEIEKRRAGYKYQPPSMPPRSLDDIILPRLVAELNWVLEDSRESAYSPAPLICHCCRRKSL